MGQKKIVHLVRHAQAEHNVQDDYTLPDPELTDLGRKQSRAIQTNLTVILQSDIKLVCSSPLRRTLSTAMYGFGDLIKQKSLPFLILPFLQECSSMACDSGSPRSILQDEYPDLDFSQLDEDWYHKRGQFASDEKSLVRRAASVRKWLADRPEDEILVVCHGSFLRYLTFEPWQDRWSNAEGRSYELKDDARYGEPRLRLLAKYTPKEVTW